MRTVGTRPRIWTVKEGEEVMEREETTVSMRTEVLEEETVVVKREGRWEGKRQERKVSKEDGELGKKTSRTKRNERTN